MADSDDSMELTVDLRTQRAVGEARAFTVSLMEMARTLDTSTISIRGAEKGLDGLSAAERKAAEESKKTAQEIEAFGKRMADARAEAERLDKQMMETGKSTDALASSVRGWISGYLGIAGVTKLMGELKAAYADMNAGQQKTSDTRLSQDKILDVVKLNLDLPMNDQGTQRARQMVEEMRTRLGGQLNFSQVGALISSTAGNRFNLGSAGGMGAATQLGQFAAVGKGTVGETEIEGLAKIMAQFGVQDDPRAANAFLGQLYTGFRKSSTRNLGEYLQAATSTLGVAKESGLGMEQSMGLLTGFLGQTPNVRRGAQGMRELMMMAEGGGPTAQSFLSSQAAGLGFTSPARVSMADIERGAAAGDQDKKGLLERIHDMDSRLGTMTGMRDKYVTSQDELHEKRSYRRATPDQREAMDAESQRILDEANKRISELQRDRNNAIKKAIDELQTANNVAAFSSLPLGRRIQMIQQMISGAGGDPTKLSAIQTGLGGEPSRFAMAKLAASKEFRAAEGMVSGAVGTPGAGGELNRAFTDSLISSTGSAASMAGGAESAVAGGSDTGGIFANQFIEAGMQIHEGQLAGVGPLDRARRGGETAIGAESQRMVTLRFLALGFLRRLWLALTASERKSFIGEFNSIGEEIEFAGGSLSDEGDKAGMFRGLKRLGNLRIMIMERRRKAGQDVSNIGPALDNTIGRTNIRAGVGWRPFIDADEPTGAGGGGPVPFGAGEGGASNEVPLQGGGAGGASTRTPPGAYGPQSMNISIGNYFSTSGPDADLAGRLEGGNG